MSGFQVGERVTVVGNKWWEGEAVVTKVPKPGAPLYFIVKMETGRMKGREGGFVAEELRPRYGPFEPGDRVTYTGTCTPTLTGEQGMVVYATETQVYVRWDNGYGFGVYPLSIALVPRVTKDGDRVRVTIEGVVDGDPSNDTIRVSPDGARAKYDNVIDVSATGVTVEDIEPEYPQGTVVKDASGVFYQRDGKLWLKFGKVAWTADHRPVRPLTVVS